jgi:uncharacterized repeat protein (TIGR03803 family)
MLVLYAAALQSCAHSDGAGSVPAVLVHRASASGFETLYDFQGEPDDGSNPVGTLVERGGTFYGVTRNGGDSKYFALGTVFSVTSTGAESVLHYFDGAAGGSNPTAGLTAINQTLYGTTFYGGTNKDGIVFSMHTDGTHFKVLHTFAGSDGSAPDANLIVVGRSLYGTTSGGGADNSGTIFTLGLDGGHFTTLHSFGSGSDGATPESGLTDVHGTLYGTTASGGLFHSGGGAGTIYTISKSGVETVIFTFDIADGEFPMGGLVALKGNLYGTSLGGGPSNTGVIFEVDKSGKTERVLHEFSYDDPAGDSPLTGLTAANGTLYGTTHQGGAYGRGTVFSMSPKDGNLSVLHAFGDNDGAEPNGLLVVNGSFYGTTFGIPEYDNGTVFMLPIP